MDKNLRLFNQKLSKLSSVWNGWIFQFIFAPFLIYIFHKNVNDISLWCKISLDFYNILNEKLRSKKKNNVNFEEKYILVIFLF